MRAILLVDHGSRQASANAQLEKVANLVAQRSEMPVGYAHMELAEPTMEAAIEALIAKGAESVVVMPYFLAPGRHATTDIPRMAHEIFARHPGVLWSVAAPLGVHELLAELVLVRVGLGVPE